LKDVLGGRAVFFGRLVGQKLVLRHYALALQGAAKIRIAAGQTEAEAERPIGDQQQGDGPAVERRTVPVSQGQSPQYGQREGDCQGRIQQPMEYGHEAAVKTGAGKPPVRWIAAGLCIYGLCSKNVDRYFLFFTHCKPIVASACQSVNSGGSCR
jgi:hypothetical protein